MTGYRTILFVLFLLVGVPGYTQTQIGGSSGTGVTSGNINGFFYVDGIQYTTLNAALTACLASANPCHLIVSPGMWSFSTQIAPTVMTIIEGAGAWSTTASGSHCLTTLSWTGAGTTVPILIQNNTASGTTLRGFCLAVTSGTPTCLLTFDSPTTQLSGPVMDHVIVDQPAVKGSTGGVCIGQNGYVIKMQVIGSALRDSGAAGTVDWLIGDTLGMSMINSRGIEDAFTTTPITLGTAAGTLATKNFTGEANDFEHTSSTAPSTNAEVQLLWAEDITLKGTYYETANAANQYAVDCPSTAFRCRNINLIGERITSVGANVETAAYHSNNADATFKVSGALLDNGAFANPHYAMQNVSALAIDISGADSRDPGFSTVSAPTAAGVNVIPSGTSEGASLPIPLSRGAAPTLTGTSACATFSTQTGGTWNGTFKCTGTSGAATITITFPNTAPNGFNCDAKDETTPADTLTPTVPGAPTTTCTFSAAAIASGDVIRFFAFEF